MAFPSPLVPLPVADKSPFPQIRTAVSSLFTTFYSHAYTLLLFTYSDYKTIVFPIAAFGAVVAPVHSSFHFLNAMIWIWVHLLHCNVSNQYKTMAEDLVNRPWRPLPSGRVSLTEASRLRALLVPLCLLLSYFHGWGVIIASAGLTTATILYDEVGLSGHWLGKNICNLIGYFTFEIGATMIMGQIPQLDKTAKKALLCSAGVILTTIHTQDFQDVVGDGKIGRITFPIYAPIFSRIFTLFAVVAWSIVLSTLWSLGLWCKIFYCSLGFTVGCRYYFLRTPQHDTRSYVLFNVWLSIGHLLPYNARRSVIAYY